MVDIVVDTTVDTIDSILIEVDRITERAKDTERFSETNWSPASIAHTVWTGTRRGSTSPGSDSGRSE